MSADIIVRQDELNQAQCKLLDAMCVALFIQEMTLKLACDECIADEKNRCMKEDVYKVGTLIDKLYQNRYEFKKTVWRDCDPFFQNKLRILTTQYHEYMNKLHKPKERETRRSTEHKVYKKMLEREKETMKKILEIASVVSAGGYDY